VSNTAKWAAPALVALALLAGLCLPQALAAIYINEFMASNQTGIQDPCEPGEYPDWIELYNSGTSAVSLANMYLTDDAAEPTKWRFVAGVTIPAQGYLLIYADDDGTQGALHTTFKLSASGEYIGLYNTNGTTVIDAITFGAQTTDVSYGRYPDGGSWRVMVAPTPGWSNNNPPPVIDNTTHSPAYPTALYPVWVTATITDDVGVSGATVTYNPGSGAVSLPMYDDGLHHDGAAGDHVYGAQIPGVDYDNTVAYYVTATDAYSSATHDPISAPAAQYTYYVGRAVCDFEADGDVDGTDLATQALCAMGPAVTPGCTPQPDGYARPDLDQDGDVDLADFLVLQSCATDPGGPADPDCGRISTGTGPTQILLNGTAILVHGPGVIVNGTIANIIAAGTYNVSGTLSDGQLFVNTEDAAPVQLNLNGVDITSTTSAPLYVAKAQSVAITLGASTVNRLTDPATHTDLTEANAALFSDASVTINGSGALIVAGRYNDAISSKGVLTIAGGTITATSVDDGIRGKESLVITGGNITVTSGGDGLKSDDDSGTGYGTVAIANATVQVTSTRDAITAQTVVTITSGTFTLTAGGGSSAVLPTDVSAKGIKGTTQVNISGGTFTINAADDGVHSDVNVTIGGGTLNIAVADDSPTTTADSDAIHADSTIVINGGTINITESYEGIEASVITINNGTIHLVSSDDGVNCSQGTANHLYVNGGYLYVNGNGDGIDVNGAINMTGGTVIVCGPTGDMNAAIDYDQTFKITGGFLLAAGSAGMAQAPSTSSTQRSVKITFSSTKAANTIVRVQKGTSPNIVDLFTFKPVKQYRSVVFSAPTLLSGTTHNIYTGGTCTGTVYDGLYSGGTYTPGTAGNTFNPTSMVTNVSSN
jgi:hypothetical protein